MKDTLVSIPVSEVQGYVSNGLINRHKYTATLIHEENGTIIATRQDRVRRPESGAGHYSFRNAHARTVFEANAAKQDSKKTRHRFRGRFH